MKGRFGIIVLCLFFLFLIIKAIIASPFIKKLDRINIVVFDYNPFFYSIDQQDSIHYAVSFYPDLKIIVPRGYGQYRVGALRKLADLEKRPEMFKQAFSYATSTFVYYYFYPRNSSIYYGREKKDQIEFPGAKKIFTYHSNAGPIERLYFFIKFSFAKKAEFTLIEADRYSKIKNNAPVFYSDDFAKEYQGFFYHRQYRAEKKTVKILFNKSYNTAVAVSTILEGSGIRVVDIASSPDPKQECLVEEDAKKYSITAKNMADYFGCRLKRGETKTSDIILTLGRAEDYWEVDSTNRQ